MAFLLLLALRFYADRLSALSWVRKAMTDEWRWGAYFPFRLLILFSILVFNNQHKSCMNLNTLRREKTVGYDHDGFFLICGECFDYKIFER